MTSIESIKGNSDKDPVFAKALENYPSFNSRLEGAGSYDDILDAIKRAAVNDSEGEMVVFDITGYKDGYEDEELNASTTSLEDLVQAVAFIRDQGAKDHDEILELVHNVPVANAVAAIWSRELMLTKDDTIDNDSNHD